jgi:Zn-dependent protease/CBS domain-containing protein
MTGARQTGNSGGSEEAGGPWTEHLRLCTVRGIPIGINWSVLVIAWLIGAGLANASLPDQYPGYSDAEYALVAAMAVALFFASILGHELAHATLAQRNGITVDGITLWLIGGVAKFSGDPPSADADMRIAGVGPVASLVIGAGWLCAAGVSGVLSVPEILIGALYWLAAINVALAVFNLLPAFPLDGGRVFRGWLWKRHGDHLRATRTASMVGRIFAGLFVVVGAAFLAGGLVLNAVWFWLIGWFLNGAAVGELQYATATAVFGGHSVADLMTSNPTTLPRSIPLRDAIDEVILRHRWSAYPVVDDSGRATGLLTLDRIRHIDPGERAHATVGDASHPIEEVAVARPSEDAVIALGRMSQHAPNRVIVLDDDGRPVGIVSITDVTRGIELSHLLGRR